jgi:hypothetical protein
MTGRHQTLLIIVVILLTVALGACQPKEVEVTRVTIMERRVIEYVEVTVPVTRIHRVVETPRPTADDLAPQLSPTPPPPMPTSPPSTSTNPTQPPAPTPSSARETGESLLAAVRDMEQTLLSLVQDLNSDPLPGAHVLQLYAAVNAAPTFNVPEDEEALQSMYVRYREQVDYVMVQATDLRAHLEAIESGEANQTEVSTIHLALARDAVSASTSTLQGLGRELETYLASLP